MSTIVVALLAAGILYAGYRTYGKFLAESIFRLDDQRQTPSHQFEDNVDFVPTRKSIVFGHHFTSIAGTGPIVGPAIAVFWGWLPALIWVLVGGLFIGAVHDFGALVISLRNKGETIGQTAGRLINPRARLLFLLILFFALSVVLGIFGLVIAQIFMFYPSSVLGTWISLPLAVLFGVLLRNGKGASHWLTMLCMIAIYAAIWIGAYYLPISVAPGQWFASLGGESNVWLSPVIFWTAVLLMYCFAASVLPVWVLLQPRDYINSWQLILALIVLVVAVFASGLTGEADLVASAPAVNLDSLPAGTPSMFPFLFITIACGAISGFHCLVSSGTTSKQISCESDSLAVGYGSMLLESGLAVMVILACCAGIGMGKFDRVETIGSDEKPIISFVPATPTAFVSSQIEDTSIESTSTEDTSANGDASEPAAAANEPHAELDINSAVVAATKSSDERYHNWRQRYDANRAWGDYRLAEKVGAFIDGGASFLTTLGIPLKFAQAMLAVLVACFAATTLDSATRLQRYVIQELGVNLKIKPLENRYLATGVAVGVGAVIALMPGAGGKPGTGGTILWPLFGATNQLLAGLAFLVIAFYLWRRKLPVYFLIPPLIIMLVVPVWALSIQLFDPESGFLLGEKRNYLLGGFGLATLALQAWMVIEAAILFPKVRGHKERRRKSG